MLPQATDSSIYPLVAPKALTVGEVVLRLKALIEQQFPSAIWIEGELSNVTYAASGHIYFTLVDEKVTDRYGQRLVLPSAFFKNANAGLKFKLTDGLKVLCLGQIGTYESRGQYQLRVMRVEPKGQGALQLAFEQMRSRLQAEGLFDEARKRPIPAWPRCIGVITSPHGSAVHDMVSKLRDWFDVVVLPCKVQGDGSAAEIAAAIQQANQLSLADVLIVGRGGGSVEDLWAFNEELVARAIFRSRIPVISAVGHQDDWTIADYVADLRASTPTDAAKRLVQERQAAVDQIQDLAQQLVDRMYDVLQDQDTTVDGLTRQLQLMHPLHQLRDMSQQAAEYEHRIIQSMRHWVDRHEHVLEGLAGRLNALSPLAVLGRGYSITFERPSGRVVTDASTVAVGDQLEILLAKGRIFARTDGSSE